MRRTTKLRPPFRLKYPGWAWVASSHARTRLGGATVTGTAQRYSGDGVARGFGATHGVGSSDAIALAETLSPAATTLIIKYRCNGTGGGGFGRLLQKGTTTNGEASLFIESSTGRLVWHRTNTSGTVLFSGRITDATTVDGLVHTLVLAHDGVSGTPTAFLDGAPQTYSFMSISTTNAANNTDAYRIGNRSDGIRGWDGLIESVVCLDLALPSAELRAISLDPSLVFRPAPEFSVFAVNSGGVGTVTASLSAAIQAARTATASVTAAVQSGRSATSSIDAAIMEGKTASASATAAISAGRSATASLSAAVQSAVSVGVSVDAAVLAEVSASATISAYIIDPGTTVVSASLSAAIQAARAATSSLEAAIQDSHAATATIDAAVAEAKAATTSVDAAIQATLSASATLSAYVVTEATDSEKIALILKILANRQELDPATGTFRLYDDDGTTLLYEVAAWEDVAGTIPYRGRGLQKLDRLE